MFNYRVQFNHFVVDKETIDRYFLSNIKEEYLKDMEKDEIGEEDYDKIRQVCFRVFEEKVEDFKESWLLHIKDLEERHEYEELLKISKECKENVAMVDEGKSYANYISLCKKISDPMMHSILSSYGDQSVEPGCGFITEFFDNREQYCKDIWILSMMSTRAAELGLLLLVDPKGTNFILMKQQNPGVPEIELVKQWNAKFINVRTSDLDTVIRDLNEKISAAKESMMPEKKKVRFT